MSDYKLAWSAVVDALTDACPGWNATGAPVDNAVAAIRAFRERQNKIVDKTASDRDMWLSGQAHRDAWSAVADALTDACPGWNADGSKAPVDNAVAAIHAFREWHRLVARQNRLMDALETELRRQFPEGIAALTHITRDKLLLNVESDSDPYCSGTIEIDLRALAAAVGGVP